MASVIYFNFRKNQLQYYKYKIKIDWDIKKFKIDIYVLI